MELIITKDYKEMSERAYQIVKDVCNNIPDPVINTTTGASYDGFFELLVEGVNNGEVSIEDATIMNLDEYIAERDKSFTVHTYMHRKFYNLINKQPKKVELLDGSLKDVDTEIKRYNKVLKEHPRDLQIVGLGVNAHLGANEPGTSFDSRLFLADSHESTIESTMRYQNLSRDEAPTQMVTLGLADIMEAKQILLVASGKRKAEAVKATVENPIDEQYPSTILRTHPNALFIVDEEAASLLSKK